MAAGQYRIPLMLQQRADTVDALGTPGTGSYTDAYICWADMRSAYKPDEIQMFESDMRQATVTYWLVMRENLDISVKSRFVIQDGSNRVFNVIGVDNLVSDRKETRVLVREVQQ